MSKLQFLWVEKYRPHRIEDCFLPPDFQQIFLKMLEQKDIPNLLLVGHPGTGKTTVARAMLEQLDVDYLFIPASVKGNIDTLRTEISQFASSVSFKGKRKYVILDEADFLTFQTQPALRNVIEQFAKNCGFILTANYKNRIIPALQSRLSTIEFNFRKEDATTLAAKAYKRTLEILDAEGITYDKKAIVEFVKKYYPDFRKILNELQLYSVRGTIDSGILVKGIVLRELIEFMKNKDFTNARKWVGENLNNNTQEIFFQFYHDAAEHFNPKFIPELVLILAKYQYQAAFVVDQEINLAACLVEIMVGALWK